MSSAWTNIFIIKGVVIINNINNRDKSSTCIKIVENNEFRTLFAYIFTTYVIVRNTQKKTKKLKA